MEGSVDHAGGWLASGENADTYSTTVPADMFHSRVAFCLKLHNQAVTVRPASPLLGGSE